MLKAGGATRQPGTAAPFFIAYGPMDVLMGRGTPSVTHTGNKYFREQIEKRKEEYGSCKSNEEKDAIVLDIVNAVAAKKGRFLQRTHSSKMANSLQIPQEIQYVWVLASADVVKIKVKQCFRDLFKKTIPGPTESQEQEDAKPKAKRSRRIAPTDSGAAAEAIPQSRPTSRNQNPVREQRQLPGIPSALPGNERFQITGIQQPWESQIHRSAGAFDSHLGPPVPELPPYIPTIGALHQTRDLEASSRSNSRTATVDLFERSRHALRNLLARLGAGDTHQEYPTASQLLLQQLSQLQQIQPSIAAPATASSGFDDESLVLDLLQRHQSQGRHQDIQQQSLHPLLAAYGRHRLSSEQQQQQQQPQEHQRHNNQQVSLVDVLQGGRGPERGEQIPLSATYLPGLADLSQFLSRAPISAASAFGPRVEQDRLAEIAILQRLASSRLLVQQMQQQQQRQVGSRDIVVEISRPQPVRAVALPSFGEYEMPLGEEDEKRTAEQSQRN